MHRMPNPSLRYGFVTGDGGVRVCEKISVVGAKRVYGNIAYIQQDVIQEAHNEKNYLNCNSTLILYWLCSRPLRWY